MILWSLAKLDTFARLQSTLVDTSAAHCSLTPRRSMVGTDECIPVLIIMSAVYL